MTEDAGEMDLGVEVSKGLAAKVVQALLGFVGTIVFARVLGPAGFGGFYLLLGLAKILDWPIDGWSVGSKKRFSEADSDRAEVMGSQFLVNAVFITVLAVGAFLGRERLASYSGVDDAWVYLLLIFGPIVFFYPFQDMVSARGKVGLATWNDTLRSVLTFAGQVLLVVAGWGVAGMTIGLAAATVLTIPISLYYIRTRPAVPGRETLQSIGSYAKFSSINAIFGKAYSRYDVLLLGLLLGPAAAGLYEVAFKLVVPATFISSIAGSGLMVKVSNLHSRGKDVTQDITNALSFAGLLAVPMFFGAAAMPRAIVRTVYGPDYTSAAPLLVGLALYQVVETQSDVLRKAIAGIDRPDLNMKISAGTLTFNVVTGYLLVLEVGAIGAVLATLLAEFGRYVVNVVVLYREQPSIDPVPTLLALEVGAGVAMFAVVYALGAVVRITSWLPLLLIVGAGAGVYFCVLTAISGQFQRTAWSVATSMGLDELLDA